MPTPESSSAPTTGLQGAPTPEKISRSPIWIPIVGAVFGGVTLIGLFAYLFIAGYNPGFVCNSFTALAAVFALGCGLSAAFIGGSAAAQGTFGKIAEGHSFAFGAGGGVAFLLIAFFVFQQFPPNECHSKLRVSHFHFLSEASREGISPHSTLRRLENRSTGPFEFKTAKEALLPIAFLLDGYSKSKDGTVDLSLLILIKSQNSALAEIDDVKFTRSNAWQTMDLAKKFGSTTIYNHFGVGDDSTQIPVLLLVECFEEKDAPIGASQIIVIAHDGLSGERDVYVQSFQVKIEDLKIASSCAN